MRDATPAYAIAVGSNRPHGRYGRPTGIVAAAIAELDRRFDLFDSSPIMLNPAAGLVGRDFANAAVLVASDLAPAAMLVQLKAIERSFGRRRGRRWSSRVLDLDILLWSGGAVTTRVLRIPHARLAERAFVLEPLRALSPGWPTGNGLAVRHLAARLAQRRPSR